MQSKRKRNSSKSWKQFKRQKADDENDERFSITERHPGSFSLDHVKTSEFYRPGYEASKIKRKYALCFGYLGTNYQGLQINPNAKTVEAEVEKALFLAGGISEANFGYFGKIQWTRAARTDRGVHAVSQCCAMKLLVDPNQRQTFIDHVNSILPSDIQLHTMTKVSKGFNAKNLCGKRTYHYLLPTYTLQDGSITNTLLQSLYHQQGPIIGAGYEGGFIDPQSQKSLHRESILQGYQVLKTYRITSEKLKRFRDTLHCYEGTHSYHNFTTGKDASEANSSRYILSFTVVNEPFIDNLTGIEYLLCAVQGQSFVLNQIRKMIGLAIAIVRDDTAIQALRQAFKPPKVI
jgi:tRNA pseudouridine38-40 synthase